MKTCTKCKKLKPLTEFHNTKHMKSGKVSNCKECKSAYDALEKNVLKIRDTGYKRRYGINLQRYNEMHKEQSGLCAICHLPSVNEKLSVDHCHSTLKIRQLLCHNCNRGLGLFKESVSNLESAIKYIKKHK